MSDADMSATEAAAVGLTHGASEDTGLGHRGPESKSIVVPYGFWLFVLSDMVLFSALFATYAALVHATDGGPDYEPAVRPQPGRGRDDRAAAVELRLRAGDDRRQTRATCCGRRSGCWSPACSAWSSSSSSCTNSRHMIGEGAGPQRSAFLSAFFTLVGCHGAHVTAGLLWIGTMMAQIWAKGFRQDIVRRLLCLSIFWHALDIIWVAIFTIVYLIGTLP